jgi:hypothetical protein
MPNAPRFCTAVRHTNRCDGPQLNPFWQSITAQKETDVHAAAIPLAADPCVGARERQSPGNRRTPTKTTAATLISIKSLLRQRQIL